MVEVRFDGLVYRKIMFHLARRGRRAYYYFLLVEVAAGSVLPSLATL